jgi:hypothetical protein
MSVTVALKVSSIPYAYLGVEGLNDLANLLQGLDRSAVRVLRPK